MSYKKENEIFAENVEKQETIDAKQWIIKVIKTKVMECKKQLIVKEQQ